MNSKNKEARLDHYKQRNWANVHNWLQQNLSGFENFKCYTSSFFENKSSEKAAKEMEKAAFQEALARKARIAEIERLLAKVSNSCESSFRSISPVDSFTEDSRLMDKTETTENGAESSSTFDSREWRQICSQRKVFRV